MGTLLVFVILNLGIILFMLLVELPLYVSIFSSGLTAKFEINGINKFEKTNSAFDVNNVDSLLFRFKFDLFACFSEFFSVFSVSFSSFNTFSAFLDSSKLFDGISFLTSRKLSRFDKLS